MSQLTVGRCLANISNQTMLDNIDLIILPYNISFQHYGCGVGDYRTGTFCLKTEPEQELTRNITRTRCRKRRREGKVAADQENI